MTAYRNLGTRGIDVPVSEPLDEDQVANNGGGFSFKLDDWSYLQRFLILGTEGGTYYVRGTLHQGRRSAYRRNHRADQFQWSG
jgi:hypothetical protein